METSIQKEVLSDGSEVFNVVAIDGSHRIVICATDEAAAERIQSILFDDAVSADVR